LKRRLLLLNSLSTASLVGLELFSSSFIIICVKFIKKTVRSHIILARIHF
jgi:hypothetical protein